MPLFSKWKLEGTVNNADIFASIKGLSKTSPFRDSGWESRVANHLREYRCQVGVTSTNNKLSKYTCIEKKIHCELLVFLKLINCNVVNKLFLLNLNYF